MSRKLTLDDIVEPRAYERQRSNFRAEVMAAKARRRVSIGTIVTVCFENRDTMRYQIQEMARVERLSTDAQVIEELAAYNPLIPEPGELSATLFIELTDDASMREWLGRLVGIERSIVIQLSDGSEVRCLPDPGHASQLTRADATAAVHYVHWALGPEQVESFAHGASLIVDHPEYREEQVLPAWTIDELLGDLRP